MDGREVETGEGLAKSSPKETSLADHAWEFVRYNPYLSLAAGPVAGGAVGVPMLYMWEPYTLVGLAAELGIPLIVTLVFLIRGTLLFSRRHPKHHPEEPRPEIGTENRVLLALREAGGSITPVEAAIETSLPVDDVEGILSGLASRGHLGVERRDGLLSYTLPGLPRAEPTALEDSPIT